MKTQKKLDVQINARVPETLRTALRTVSAMTGFSIEELLNDSIIEYFDCGDDLTTARRKRAMDALRRVYGKKPNLLALE